MELEYDFLMEYHIFVYQEIKIRNLDSVFIKVNSFMKNKANNPNMKCFL